MNENLLTPIEPLDLEHINIPGLDIDSDFEKTVKAGKKKVRNKKIINSCMAAFVVLLITGFSSLFFGLFDGSESKNIRTVSNVPVSSASKNEPEIPEKIVSTTVPEIAQRKIGETQSSATRPNGNSAISFNYGSPTKCTPDPAVFEPNPDTGEIIGTSKYTERWNPSSGQMYAISKTDGSELVLVARQFSNSANFYFADLASGFNTNPSQAYAFVSPNNLRYCENGLSVDGTYTQNGYVLNVERW